MMPDAEQAMLLEAAFRRASSVRRLGSAVCATLCLDTVPQRALCHQRHNHNV
jgi:hypothetical protein